MGIEKQKTGEKIGYARVSTKEQHLESQIDNLKKTGCKKLFTDKISGINESRPGWDKLLDYAREGDTVVVTELSRMSRSLPHLLDLVKLFSDKGIGIQSLRENIDTSTATGRFFISMMGAISQMESELKKERATAGRVAARARGRSGGRPKTDPLKLEQAKILYENSDKSAQEICESLGLGRRTFFKFLKSDQIQEIAN